MLIEKNLINIFSALSHPVRLAIFLNIYKAQQQEIKLNLLESVYPHKLVRSSIKHHMDILVQSGLINREKTGKNVFLSLMPGALEDAEMFFRKINSNEELVF